MTRYLQFSLYPSNNSVAKYRNFKIIVEAIDQTQIIAWGNLSVRRNDLFIKLDWSTKIIQNIFKVTANPLDLKYGFAI